MCDPVSLITGAVVGTVASKVLTPKPGATASSASSAADPAAERAKAEAEAAQRANAQLADANRRRREQQSLMARGAPATPTAPQFSLGDSTLDPGQSPLTPGASLTTRSTTARAASLMSRGAPAGLADPRYSGGGRGSDYRMSAL